ncbi:MAG TPA: Do family serine endopeptidase [Burkholderiales bacterium]|nr:Do family serine endopeptidase [Burkholderiales bacterium]
MRALAPLLLLPLLAACGEPEPFPRTPQPRNETSVPAASRSAALPDFTALIRKQGPAVVAVVSTRRPPAAAAGTGAPEGTPPDPMLEFFRRFMPDMPERGGPREGLGSGFIISKDGYILTNAHVVANADEVSVRLADAKRELKASVVGIDKRTDVALLKVDGGDLPVARLGDSSRLQPGEWVAAIGSPFGFSNTITAGIVSAKERALPDEMYIPFIQTDVAVNPGNSGGPLLNLAGEVVGVNSMIYSGTGGYMGVSFAIPIEVALEVVKQLQSSGKVTRGRVGIGIQPLTKELAQSFGLEEATGAVIVNVEKGGPADRAGARVGDVVLAWNGEKLEDPNELPRLVAATKPGTQASLDVIREGSRQTLKVEVGEIVPEAAVAKAEPAPREAPNRLGLAVRELPEAERRTLGVDYALVVTEVVGPAARSSPVLPGDIIVAVNQQRFSSLEEFNRLVARHGKDSRVALLVRRGNSALYVPIPAG